MQGELPPPSDGLVTGPIFVGLFPGRIAQGRPLRYAMLDQRNRFEFTQVPCGRWHLLCHAEADELDRPSGGRRRMTAAVGPITIRPSTIATVSTQLRLAGLTDPPALLALPPAS